jgi:hypothetical protein
MTGKFSHRAVAAGIAEMAAGKPKPAPRSASIPKMAIAGAALLAVAGISFALLRSAPAASVEPVPVAALIEQAAPTQERVDETARLFEGQDPALRPAVEGVLARYARALEAIDAALLAEARPDMPARERTALMAEREGASNIAADLRVVGVATRRSQATVTIRRTEVIVAGHSVDRPSVEETLRFQREGAAWVLRPAR